MNGGRRPCCGLVPNDCACPPGLAGHTLKRQVFTAKGSWTVPAEARRVVAKFGPVEVREGDRLTIHGREVTATFEATPTGLKRIDP